MTNLLSETQRALLVACRAMLADCLAATDAHTDFERRARLVDAVMAMSLVEHDPARRARRRTTSQSTERRTT